MTLETEHSKEELKHALDRAKIALFSSKNSVFISTILFNLKLRWGTQIPTAGVDGIHLYINPNFFMELEEPERVFLLAHEAWHVAFDHINRGNIYSDQARYNEAADYVINLMLKDANYQMPEGGLCSEDYRNMYTEEVYRLLEDKPQNNQGGGGPGNFGSDLMPPSAENAQAIQQQVNDILIKAHQTAKMAGDDVGNMPGDVLIAIDELINPKLPWRTILQNYMNGFAKDDYSYLRPNRRYMPDHILPTLHSEGMGEIAIAVDTSGSVSDSDFQAFLSEIEDIRVNLKPSVTTIIDFDTQINNVHKLTPDANIQEVAFTGRGGTYLQPVFDYYNTDKPVVLIVFSDLYCDQIQEAPDYPVIWICVDNPNAEVKFGQLIHYET